MSDKNVKFLSVLLKEKGELQDNIIESYSETVKALNALNEKKQEDIEFINDYIMTMSSYTRQMSKRAAATQIIVKSNEPQPSTSIVVAREEPKINWRDLVREPEKFDGQQPRPREWLESFNDAIVANNWTDEIVRKYFQSFLKSSALFWFKMQVQPKLNPYSTWLDIKREFVNQYLGSAEKASLRKEFDNLQQRRNENANVFIPRAHNLLYLINNELEEEEIVDMIRDKLRYEIVTGLAAYQIDSVNELTKLAIRVENNLRRVDKRAEVKNYSKQDEHTTNKYADRKPNKNQMSNSYNKKDTNKPKEVTNKKPSIKCYRCERLGHIAKECRAKTKQDGKPCNEQRNKVSHVDANTELNRDIVVRTNILTVSNERELTYSNLDSNRAATVRERSTKTIEKKATNASLIKSTRDKLNLVVASNKRMIIQPVKCNKQMIQAVIDTGAYHTVLDESIARKYDWPIEKPAPVLMAAGKSQLLCKGTTKLELEMQLGHTTRAADIHVAVVTNLGIEMLLGLEVAALFKIIIDTSMHQLSFKKSSLKRGVLVDGQIELPPRTQTIARVHVNFVGSIQVDRINFDNRVLVASSINEVVDNKTDILIANISNDIIKLAEGKQIAQYVPHVDFLDESISGSINTIMKLDDTNETTNVGDNLDRRQLNELSALFEKHRNVFSLDGKLGRAKTIEHTIELLEQTKPVAEPLRRRPLSHVDETKRQVERLLRENVIEESRSPWASAYVLAREKNGEYRLCIDFRRLNKATKKVAYPLPNPDDCVEALARYNYYSIIDFASGFWQVPLAENSREYTAFQTETGLYQFKVMPMGLCNSPATFQKLANALVAGLRGFNLQVFIDDICIGTKTWEEHLKLLDKLFSLIEKEGLKLRSDKCHFGVRMVTFLGHLISARGIEKDPNKVRAMAQIPCPTNVKETRQVLGLFGYYRKFVENFAAKAGPLIELTRKNAKFVWGEKQQQAFDLILDELKKCITLAHFNHRDPLLLKTDASKLGVAGMLMQKQQGEWRLISCCSRRLTDSERNYGITDLEGLAIIYSVTKFRNYLLGKKFQIPTDHSALKVLNERMPSSDRLKRWAAILAEFDFEIVYTKGELHSDVDCLSRAPIDPPDRYLEDKVYRKMFNMSRKITELENAEVAVKIQGHGLTYSLITKILLIFLFISAIIITGTMTHFERRGQRRHEHLLQHIQQRQVNQAADDQDSSRSASDNQDLSTMINRVKLEPMEEIPEPPPALQSTHYLEAQSALDKLRQLNRDHEAEINEYKPMLSFGKNQSE